MVEPAGVGEQHSSGQAGIALEGGDAPGPVQLVGQPLPPGGGGDAGVGESVPNPAQVGRWGEEPVDPKRVELRPAGW